MNSYEQSVIWLNSRGLKNYWQKEPRVYVSESDKKINLMAEYEISFSIDDKAETVEMCNRLLTGHQAYLLDRPWNQDSKEPRVYSMEEFLDKVKNAA
jgi:hypothetical protein